MSKLALITGANRGIGLSFAKHYVNQGYKVIATARNPSAATELKKLSCTVLPLDVSSDTSIKHLAQELKSTNCSIDLLINNAGIIPKDTLQTCTRQNLLEAFSVNACGPVLVTQAFLPLLNNNSKVVCISSGIASIQENTFGGFYSGRASKTALNAMVKSMMFDLKKLKVPVLALDPGMVKTDLTGGKGECFPDEAVEKMAKRISELNLENSGKYQHRDGRFILY